MEQPDEIFKKIGVRQGPSATLIACLYTGTSLPTACAPMPRDPAPATGALLDADFGATVAAALAVNHSVHDGAVMLGRASPASSYRVTGWSYRLYPSAESGEGGVNRGSAFHSCRAMSLERDVDAAYLVSQGRGFRFVNGVTTEL